MLTHLTGILVIALSTQTFGQFINCSIGVGYNGSSMGVISVPTLDGYPYPYATYPSLYSNGSYIEYEQLQNGSNVYYGSAAYNISRSSNSNVDCYMFVKWQNGPLIGQTNCRAYSVIMNPLSIVGCYDYSSICPTSCTPQYILSNNHSYFGTIYLDAIADAKKKHHYTGGLINHETSQQAVNCSTFIGYNSSTLFNNTYYPTLLYFSLYSSGTMVAYEFNGNSFGTASYTISPSTSGYIECNMYLKWNWKESTTWCISYSITMNGSAIVGCIAHNSSCPTTCSPQEIFIDDQFWVTGFRLNMLDDNYKI